MNAANCTSRSTQPCIPPGLLNRVSASAEVRAGMSPLPGGRWHCVILCGMQVYVAVTPGRISLAKRYAAFTLLLLQN